MSPGISLSVHWWRDFGFDVEPDEGTFVVRLRLGIVTLVAETDDWLPRFRKMRATIIESLATTAARLNAHRRADEEGR